MESAEGIFLAFMVVSLSLVAYAYLVVLGLNLCAWW